jgi:molybdenum cofactor cytidylyltransferase
MGVKHLEQVPVRFVAVVLAAGAGRRFGGGKLVAPWRGGVLLDGALAAAFAAPVEAVVVVTGSDPAVAPTAEAFASARGETARLRIVLAHDWAEGLSASLKAGLSAVPPEASGAFVFLGDMPDLPHALAGRLAALLGPGVEAVQPVVRGAPAHPVLLARALFPAAGRLAGDRGAQPLLAGAKVVRLDIDAPGATLDVDTPDALAHLEGRG